MEPFCFLRRATLAIFLASFALMACSRGPAADAGADENAAAERKADGKRVKDRGDEQKVVSVPVEVALVSRRTMSARYNATASLQAVSEAQVVSMTSGVLLALLAEEGDRVKAGQVLARLDPDRKGLALAQAEAQLRKLESEYKRSSELFARQLVSADAHGKIRSELEIQRAAVSIARLELDYTQIKAPISGVIAQRMVKVGNLIQPNTPLFTIVDNSRLEAVLNVPEREFATMHAGLPVSMQVDALPGQTFSGVVDRVSPVIDAGSGTFRVTARFDGKMALQPGMFGRIDVVYDRRENALVVPRAALLEDEGGVSVFVVREGKAVRVPIQIGYLEGDFAEVRGGLAEGNAVVTVGKITLRDGAMVEVVNGVGEAGAVAAMTSVATATRQ